MRPIDEILSPFQVPSVPWNEKQYVGKLKSLSAELDSQLSTLVDAAEDLSIHAEQDGICSGHPAIASARFVEAVWWRGEACADADTDARRAWLSGLRSRAALARWTVHTALSDDSIRAAFGTLRPRLDSQEQWLRVLDTMYDDPWLLQRPATEITPLLRQLTATNDPKEPERSQRVIEAVITRHLLPRFDLVGTHRAVRNAHGRAVYWVWSPAALAILASIALAGLSQLGWAIAAALAAYGWMILGAASIGAMILHPLCMRAPAGALLGAFGLFAIGGWEEQAMSFDPWLHLGVIAAPLPYLILEARHREAQGLIALGRALAVYAIVMLHSAAVAVIAVGVGGPAFLTVDKDAFVATDMARSWLIESTPNRYWLLWFVAGAAATAGTYLQVLWEDNPITAPLSRFTWGSR